MKLWYNTSVQEKCEKVLKNKSFLNIKSLYSYAPTEQADGRCIHKEVK